MIKKDILDNKKFLNKIEEMKKSGSTEKDIYTALGMTRAAFRLKRAGALANLGNPNNDISTKQTMMNIVAGGHIADLLKIQLLEQGIIDVTNGVISGQKNLSLTPKALRDILAVFKSAGYPVYNVRIEAKNNPLKWTSKTFLCLPGTEVQRCL